MPPDQQQAMPLDTGQSFWTDEQLAVRVKQAENALHHLEAQLPSLQRELAELKRILEPCRG